MCVYMCVSVGTYNACVLKYDEQYVCVHAVSVCMCV